jgi:hypothetical protein
VKDQELFCPVCDHMTLGELWVDDECEECGNKYWWEDEYDYESGDSWEVSYWLHYAKAPTS